MASNQPNLSFLPTGILEKLTSDLPAYNGPEELPNPASIGLIQNFYTQVPFRSAIYTWIQLLRPFFDPSQDARTIATNRQVVQCLHRFVLTDLLPEKISEHLQLLSTLYLEKQGLSRNLRLRADRIFTSRWPAVQAAPPTMGPFAGSAQGLNMGNMNTMAAMQQNHSANSPGFYEPFGRGWHFANSPGHQQDLDTGGYFQQHGVNQGQPVQNPAMVTMNWNSGWTGQGANMPAPFNPFGAPGPLATSANRIPMVRPTADYIAAQSFAQLSTASAPGFQAHPCIPGRSITTPAAPLPQVYTQVSSFSFPHPNAFVFAPAPPRFYLTYREQNDLTNAGIVGFERSRLDGYLRVSLEMIQGWSEQMLLVKTAEVLDLLDVVKRMNGTLGWLKEGGWRGVEGWCY